MISRSRVVTPALALLAQHNVWHRLFEYEHQSSAQGFGQDAAQKLRIRPDRIYKTLLVQASDGQVANAVLAVSDMLNLKRLAHALGVKRAEMAQATLAEHKTGYALGGIAPFGQKSQFATVLDDTVHNHETVLVSGGRRGLSLELRVTDLVALTSGIVCRIRRA